MPSQAGAITKLLGGSQFLSLVDYNHWSVHSWVPTLGVGRDEDTCEEQEEAPSPPATAAAAGTKRQARL